MEEKENTMNPSQTTKSKHTIRLLAGWLIVLFTTFVYVGSEWLFMITKPSSMSQTILVEKITIPIFAIAFLTLLACLIQAVLYLLIHRKCDDNFWVSRLMMIIPSLVLALTILLIIDNLTYITMSVGIITSRRFVRIFYALGFLLVVGYLIFDLAKLQKALIYNLSRRKKEKNNRFAVILMSVIIVIVIIGFVIGFIQNNREKLEVLNIPNKKNVVLLLLMG